MQRFILILLLFFSVAPTQAQLTGDQLLKKAIAYHDPHGNWKNFSGVLFVTMESPNQQDRVSKISIDLPKEYFSVKATRGKNSTTYSIDRGKCSIKFNGKDPSDEVKKENNLSCNRAELYKNYYTYLYGLPMKLEDPGTQVHKTVEKRKFKGKEYLVLKVSYDQKIGTDIWFFYFDPKTYAMEIYQFLKNSKPNTGEYILLTELEEINQMKIPKRRAWYYNDGDGYLGTDVLTKATIKN